MARPKNKYADPVRIRQRRNRFAIVFYPTGLITEPTDRECLPETFETRAEAEQVAAELRADLMEVRADNEPRSRSSVRLSSAIEDYIVWWNNEVTSDNAALGTMKKRVSDVRVYLDDLAATGVRVRSITEVQARSVISDTRTATKKVGELISPKATNTVETAVTSLRFFGRWLADHAYVSESPFEFLDTDSLNERKAKKRAKRQRVKQLAKLPTVPADVAPQRSYSLSDVPSLADVANFSNAILRRETNKDGTKGSRLSALGEQEAWQLSQLPMLGAASGLRHCELLVLHTRRIDLEKLEIDVVEQLDRSIRWLPGEPPPTIPPKGSVTRKAKVWPTYGPILSQLCAFADERNGGWIFPPVRGVVWWADATLAMYNRAADLLKIDRDAAFEAGVPNDKLPSLWPWGTHITRHAYGSYSLAQTIDGGHGWSVAAVQQSMGHKSEKTTLATYRHVLDSEHQRMRTQIIAWPGMNNYDDDAT